MENLRYGESEIASFDVEKDLEIWENKHERDYVIKITLPEFCCRCPRSGYPDFATIQVEYIPNKSVVELKAIKLYINSFMNRHISHEDSINEIYGVLESKLEPKFLKVTGDFNPRGNVHTVIEISSESVLKKPEFKPEKQENFDRPREFKSRDDNRKAGARRIGERERKFSDKKDGSRSAKSDKSSKFNDKFKDDKPRKSAAKEGFKKISYEGEKKARVVKKDK